MRMAMAQRVDGDTGGEVEIPFPSFADQITALASHRPHTAPRVNGHERGDGHGNCTS
jgi:hypothetical protein